MYGRPTIERTFRARRVLPQGVTVKRGGYSGRYEVYIDGQYVGWVIKNPRYEFATFDPDRPKAGTWQAFVKARPEAEDFTGRCVDTGATTRVDAVSTVLFGAAFRERFITRERYDEAYNDSWYEPVVEAPLPAIAWFAPGYGPDATGYIGFRLYGPPAPANVGVSA
jgi:hypothetical protein